jgi:cryptochrome 1
MNERSSGTHRSLSRSHRADPLSLVQDYRVKEQLAAEGIDVQSFNADLMYEPWEVLDEDRRPFTMFAPFWNRCLCMPDPATPQLPPKRINSGIQMHNRQSSNRHTVGGDPVLAYRIQSLTWKMLRSLHR